MSSVLFSSIKIKPKRIPLYVLTLLLLISVLLVIGFLSFIEMLSLNTSIGWAIGAFIFAGLVEGQVYAKNIYDPFKKLFGNKYESSLYFEHFLLFLEQNKDNELVKAYISCKDEISKLKKQLRILKWKIANSPPALDGSKYEEAYEAVDVLLTEKKKTIRWMQEYFADFIKKEDVTNETLQNIDKDKRQEIQKAINQKKWLSRACFVASLITGIGYGFVFLHVAPESIVAFAAYFGKELLIGALPLSLNIVIDVFAFAAGAGFMLVIQNTLSKMVDEEAFTKGLKKLREFFSPQKNEFGRMETGSDVFFRVAPWVLVGLIVLALCIFAGVTTSGTCWFEAQGGAAFLVPYIGEAASWICGFTVAVMAATTLIFTLFNSMRAVKALAKGSIIAVEKSLREAERNVEECYDNETGLQFVNPFRFICILISLPFKPFVFLYHIISTGVVGEGSNLLPKEWEGWTTFLNALPDAAVDGFFLFSDDDHGHSHSSVPEFFLNVVLWVSLLKPLSILWDWAFSKSGSLTGWQAFYRALFGVEANPEPNENKSTKIMGDKVLTNDLKSPVLRNLLENKVNKKVDKTLPPADRLVHVESYATKLFSAQSNERGDMIQAVNQALAPSVVATNS